MIRMNNFQSKPKLLAILHLPPPFHGASMMGVLFLKSKLIHDAFSVRSINLGAAKALSEIEVMSLSKILVILKIYWQILIAIIFNRPDLVYVTANASGASFWKDFFVVVLLKLFGIKHCMHYHNKGFYKLESSWIGRKLLRLYFYKSTPILLSKFLTNDLGGTGKFLNFKFCAPGVELPIEFAELDSSDRPVRILYLSNLIVEKGVIELLEACKILRDEGLQFECLFAGQPGDISVDAFEKQKSAWMLDDTVKYLGPIYGQDKHALYCSADIFAFPTYYKRECFPLVLLEAMSYGLPIVSTPEAAIPEIISDGVNGYLCDKRDAKSLADALGKLLGSIEHRKKLGENSRKLAENMYTTDHYERNMSKILLAQL